jgi:hypothetical protein
MSTVSKSPLPVLKFADRIEPCLYSATLFPQGRRGSTAWTLYLL